jgi:hypothetical protein
MKEPPDHLEAGRNPICHSLWSKILCRGDLKKVKPIIAKARKTNDGRWSRSGSTRDLPTIAFFRAGTLLRRHGPVPGILAAHRPGAIMDKSGPRGVVRFGLGQSQKAASAHPGQKQKASTIQPSY